MSRTGKSMAYISVDNKSKALFMEVKEVLNSGSSADTLEHLCKFFVKNYDTIRELKDSTLSEAQLHNKIVPPRQSIQNFLKRFESNEMTEEDYKTTIRDIMWNVDELIKLIKV